MKDILTAKKEINFNNTKIAFAYKTDEELKLSAKIFSLMNRDWLVRLGSKIGVKAIKWNLPFAESIVESTLFEHFCSGTTLLNSRRSIYRLYKHRVMTVLDYGAEGKTTETDFNNSMNESIRSIEFASKEPSISCISIKLTALGNIKLLQKVQDSNNLSEQELLEYKNVMKRVDSICYVGHERNIKVFIDAEESWIQETIDFIARKMMRRYNKEVPIVYNTFQLYRKDKLQYLIDSYEDAKREKYLLGAKLVRGAYMKKENERAVRLGYDTPIQPNKESTDNDFNTAIKFCVDNYLNIASVTATHNADSCLLQANLIEKKGIAKNHPNLSFCQLYGMSDNLTFNLTNAGYNVSKYMVYGPIKEVIPYLVRRAQENTSITGDVSREYKLVMRELKRRGLK